MNVADDYEAPMQMLTTEKYIAARHQQWFNSYCLYQRESRDSSVTRIFFKKNRMMQHRAQKLTTKF